ncbi:MAG: InlB B-repeat-containing protein, partial [Clostridia bacterium]|nr:InlB B-repeat-containing protein [Clostridia bacterium]
MLSIKSYLKRVLSLTLTLIMILSIFSVGVVTASAEGYDPTAALAYAKAHWNDGKGECAEFVKDCLKAGGLTSLTSINCRGLKDQIVNGGWGTLQTLTVTNGKFLYSVNRDIVSAGDPIIWYCHKCKIYPHIVICGGYNSSGYLTYYSHNRAHNNDTLYFDLGSSDHKGHTFTAYSIQMNTSGFYPISEYLYAKYCVTAESTSLRKAPYTEVDGEDTAVFTSAAETILIMVGAHVNNDGEVYYKTDSGYWVSAADVEKVEDLESLSISGQTLPENLKKGSSFSLKGTVKSASSAITELTAGIYYDDGETAATSKTVSPDTVTASLSLVDNYISFGKLLSGNYIYKVTAKNALCEVELINHPFTVLGTDEVAITFDANGGECDTASATYTAGTVVGELPTPTREDYIFMGWLDANGNPFTSESYATATMTVTAQWKSTTPTADELVWEEKLDVYASFVIGENGATSRTVPYVKYPDTTTAADELDAGEMVVIVGSTTNYYGEKWYMTEDGNWIISTDGEIGEQLVPFTLSEDTNYPDKIKLAYTACKLTGTITSLGGNITTVNGGIFDLNGNRVYGKTVTVNAETFNIKTIDDAIAFRSLGVGEYYYR